MPALSRLKNEFSFFAGNYRILVLSWILMDFANEIPGTYYALYVLALGGTPSTIGLIGFAAAIALAAVQFPGGYLADRFGRRWLVSTMTFGVAFSFLFYAFAPSWEYILVGAVIANLSLIYQPALLAMVADSLPPERRGMGFSFITVIEHAATTPGPIIAGLLFLNFGLVNGVRIGYLVLVGLYFAAAVLRSKLRETISHPPKITAKEILRTYPTSLREGAKVWRTVSPSVRFLFLANLLGAFGSAMIMPFVVIYAVKDLNITEVQWSVLLTVLFITMILFAVPAGKLIDTYGRKGPLILSSLILVPATVLFVYGDFARLLVALPLYGLSGILGHVAGGSLQADLVPKEQRGKIIGSSNFVNYILMAFGALLGGLIYETISHQLPFVLVVALALPQLLLIAFLVHEPEKRQA